MMASVELPELGLFYSNTPIAPNSLSSCYNPTRLHTKSPNAKQAQGTSQKGIKKKFGQWKPVDAAGYSALVKNSRDLRSG